MYTHEKIVGPHKEIIDLDQGAHRASKVFLRDLTSHHRGRMSQGRASWEIYRLRWAPAASTEATRVFVSRTGMNTYTHSWHKSGLQTLSWLQLTPPVPISIYKSPKMPSLGSFFRGGGRSHKSPSKYYSATGIHSPIPI